MTPPSRAPAAPPGYALRIVVFFATYFLFTGVFLPFFPVWLKGRGLTDVEIAIAVALPTLMRVLAAPFAGIYADRTPNRRFAALTLTIPAVIVFAFAWPAAGFVPILVITTLAVTLWAITLPPVEALALTGVRRFGLDYGRMRLGGSLAFIIANLGAGALLGFLGGSEPVYWLMLGGLMASLLGAFLLPVTPRAQRALDDAAKPDDRPSRAVLGHAGLLGLLIAAGLIQSSHGVLYGFGSIEWHRLGYSAPQIGVFWATGILGEVALFFWSTQVVRRFGPLELTVIAGVAAVVRWGLFPFDMGFAGFALLQALHGLTFGATYLGTQHAIARMVPERLTASAQSMYMMIAGLIFAATTFLAGPLYAAFGIGAFPTMTVPAVVALGIVAVVRRKGWA